MSGQWRQDGPSTPDKIKSGAGATLETARSPRAAIIAVSVVAVILVAALIWATIAFGGGDPAADPSPSPSQSPVVANSDPSTEPEVEGPIPDGGYELVIGDACLRLSTHPDDLPDRFVIAHGECGTHDSAWSVTAVDSESIRIGFQRGGFDGLCLQPDGPDLNDKSAKPEDLYYFAPYQCDDDARLQDFQLVPVDDKSFQLQTAAKQCLAVFAEWQHPQGDGVGTAPCASSPAVVFRPLKSDK